MIKIETHCHTGGSLCADSTVSFIAKKYKDYGYGGIVVTNHFYQSVYNDLWEGKNHKEKIDFFFSLYDSMRNECEKLNLKTFLGVEIAVNSPMGHSEYILYNFDKSLLYDNKPLFEFTQEELFNLINNTGIFMYKAHPFREGEYCGNPKFIHGAECFNGHFNHNNHNDLAEEFCAKNNLIKMSGTDYHHNVQPISAGIIIPDNINTEKELVSCIYNGEYKMIKDESNMKFKVGLCK